MTNQEIKNIQENFENTLKEKLEGRIYNASECIQLVSLIGTEFTTIASGKFGIKEFNIQQSKESYASALVYKIMYLGRKIVDIIISVSELSDNNLQLEEVMCDIKLNEEILKELKEKQIE